MNVSLLVTCLSDVLFPRIGVATTRLLRRMGVRVSFPTGQTCCGQPQYNSGYHDDARNLAKHTIQTFERAERVVVPSGSCAAMVKLEFPELFKDEPSWHKRSLELASRTHELSDYIVNVLGRDDVGARFPGRVTYHMSCHLRGLRLFNEPIRLLRNVRDLTLIDLERADECCGFGGSFAVRYQDISGAMVRDKCRFIENAGVDAVVATDAGCLMNMGGYLRRERKAIKTLHLAEVLEAT
ncbi:MAG: (Fe-S)-binding protein [Planctomycetia bacterium]|nr:(Fe-S)-binding protein [Planctomycetia bacterium]